MEQGGYFIVSKAIERFYRERMFYQELATLVPLRTPRLLADQRGPATYEGREGDALLIAAYHQPALSPNRWQEEDSLEAVRQPGELHGRFWLKQPTHSDLSADTHNAYGDWDTLQQRL